VYHLTIGHLHRDPSRCFGGVAPGYLAERFHINSRLICPLHAGTSHYHVGRAAARTETVRARETRERDAHTDARAG
jgi:hypothetical protein